VEAAKTIGQDQARAGVLAGDRVQMARLRQSDAGAAGKTPKKLASQRAAKTVAD
jgi:hypothetical protein